MYYCLLFVRGFVTFTHTCTIQRHATEKINIIWRNHGTLLKCNMCNLIFLHVLHINLCKFNFFFCLLIQKARVFTLLTQVGRLFATCVFIVTSLPQFWVVILHRPFWTLKVQRGCVFNFSSSSFYSWFNYGALTVQTPVHLSPISSDRHGTLWTSVCC